MQQDSNLESFNCESDILPLQPALSSVINFKVVVILLHGGG